MGSCTGQVTFYKVPEKHGHVYCLSSQVVVKKGMGRLKKSAIIGGSREGGGGGDGGTVNKRICLSLR